MTTEATLAASAPTVDLAPRVSTGRAGRVLVWVSLATALATFLILMGLSPIAPTEAVVAGVLAANGLLAVALVVVVVREIMALRRSRRMGQAASRLHERVVRLFAIVATIPVVVISIAASVTLDRGLANVFNSDVRPAIEVSNQVASAYLSEHARALRADLALLVGDMDRAKALRRDNPAEFRRLLTQQALSRGFAVVRLVDSDGAIIEQADIPLPAPFSVPADRLAEAMRSDDLMMEFRREEDRAFSDVVLRFKPGLDEFLYVVRPIDPRIADFSRASQLGVFGYEAFQARRFNVQLAIAIMFTLIALLVTLSAVYVGLGFANRLVQPIRRLIGAANQVAAGKLDTEVHIRKSEGDLAKLGDTFNTMTAQLRGQRRDLMAANEQIDSRRRFIEAIFMGVGAGVVGIDKDTRVTLSNPTAADLLGRPGDNLIGQKLGELLPEAADLLVGATVGTQKLLQGQVTVVRDGRERTLVVRAAGERDEDGAHGAVVTIDDVTDLVVAQRTSAWADIARRIAHEIKNPLTPIQLSAERLKRRYGRAITEDREIFDQCTDTIIRQVGDIGRMVDEFSSFARMPKPVFAEDDVVATVRQVAFLMRMGNPDIAIEEELPDGPVRALVDRRLISQALTNIVKNATEAVGALDDEARGEKGRILLRMTQRGDEFEIDVIDNGIGLPKENRHRLLEPYVTNRAKGTGLGLAIVGKILEEHGGGIELLDAPPRADGGRRGALIRLRFRDRAPIHEAAE